jgi:NAD(P)-dependent dehydrogenase (short-subunit alcohol dehydrogenase family)
MPSAIVTGSDRGIGNAIAVRLARDGFDIGITYVHGEEGARETAAEVESEGRRAEIRRLDLTDLGSVQPTVDELAEALGDLFVLVNNAGTGASTPFLEVPLDEWREVLDTDLTGAFLAAQAAARRMVRRGDGGRIVNITSIHEHLPLEGSSAYCAAKGGLGLLTKVMAVELGEHGITVNAVAPGEIATRMTGAEDEDPKPIERPMIPAGRPGHAHEIAGAVSYLCSPEGAYATGASVIVDGGLGLMGPVANARTGSG